MGKILKPPSARFGRRREERKADFIDDEHEAEDGYGDCLSNASKPSDPPKRLGGTNKETKNFFLSVASSQDASEPSAPKRLGEQKQTNKQTSKSNKQAN